MRISLDLELTDTQATVTIVGTSKRFTRPSAAEAYAAALSDVTGHETVVTAPCSHGGSHPDGRPCCRDGYCSRNHVTHYCCL